MTDTDAKLAALIAWYAEMGECYAYYNYERERFQQAASALEAAKGLYAATEFMATYERCRDSTPDDISRLRESRAALDKAVGDEK